MAGTNPFPVNATLLLSVIFGNTSFNALLGLLTLPIAGRSFRMLRENYMDRVNMAPANLATIQIHAFTLIGLIAGYLAAGMLS